MTIQQDKRRQTDWKEFLDNFRKILKNQASRVIMQMRIHIRSKHYFSFEGLDNSERILLT